jgi:hypothetical protein
MIQTRIYIMILLHVYVPNSSYMGTMLSVLMFIDIDECALETDRCDQDCHNAVGNYTCSCRTGYTLSGRFTCLSEQENPWYWYYLYLMWKTTFYQILMSVPLASTSVIRLVQIRRGPTPAGVSWDTHWMLMDAPAMVYYIMHAWSAVGTFRYRRELLLLKEACN